MKKGINVLKEYIVVFLSIFAGAGGYLLTTFWFQPIIRYREIKHEVFADLIFYANAINSDGFDKIIKNRMEQRAESNRRHSAELRASYRELPYWYKKWLERNGENPMDAATQLMGLSNTIDFDNADKRIEKIKKNLKILTNSV